MKTQLQAILVFLLVSSLWRILLVSVALCLRPQKNQPSLAGSLTSSSFISCLTALLLLFLPASLPPALFHSPASHKLISQTPNSP